jgi:hypothetical protein
LTVGTLAVATTLKPGGTWATSIPVSRVVGDFVGLLTVLPPPQLAARRPTATRSDETVTLWTRRLIGGESYRRSSALR